MLLSHALAVGPDTGATAWQVGSEDSPVWAELTRIREELLWSRMDRVLTAGALIRVAAAATWVALAVVTGAQVWWGACLLAGGLLALLHARRGTVLLIADNAGPMAGVVRWLLPYPRAPHVNPVGMVEAAGTILANLGTGWIGGAFLTTSNAHAAAPAATVLLVVYDISVVVNLTGHVTWQFEPVAAFYRRVRPLLAPVCAGIAAVLLWPHHDLGTAYPAAVVTVVVGGCCVCLAGWAARAFLESTARLSAQSLTWVRRATQAVDGRYVHQLKNLARILYQRSDEIPAGDLRERVRRLSVAISSTEQMFKSGRGTPARCVEEVVDGLLGLDERFTALRHIDADLDLRDLTSGDAELVAIAVGDLCSNAINARATRFRVGLRAEEGEHGTWLTLEAECVCGKVIPEVAEDSSLMRLATLLHYNRGTFVIRDDGGSHRFVLRWPSTSRPRAGARARARAGAGAGGTTPAENPPGDASPGDAPPGDAPMEHAP